MFETFLLQRLTKGRRKEMMVLAGLLLIGIAIGLMLSGTIAQAIGIRNLFIASAAMLGAVAAFGYVRLQSR
jgi:positive regulator of sigma E activity